jgi:hypothetical protein
MTRFFARALSLTAFFIPVAASAQPIDVRPLVRTQVELTFEGEGTLVKKVVNSSVATRGGYSFFYSFGTDAVQGGDGAAVLTRGRSNVAEIQTLQRALATHRIRQQRDCRLEPDPEPLSPVGGSAIVEWNGANGATRRFVMRIESCDGPACLPLCPDAAVAILGAITDFHEAASNRGEVLTTP